MEFADRHLLASNRKDYLSYALFLIKQSVKQVILCFPGELPITRSVF